MTFQPASTQGPFLPINQTFSTDQEQRLIQQTLRDRDIARNVNIRDIAIYDLTQSPSGRQWFTPGNPQVKRGAFRQVFTFTATGSITHNISGITLSLISGQYTDGTNFYGVIGASSVTIAGQVTAYVTPTTIVIQSGAGAPAITSGIVVLDYLLN